MNFQEKIENIISKNNSLLCIGLDSDFDRLPLHMKSLPNPQFEFNTQIIDATHDLVCVYKPNTAFYEGRGAKGIEELKMTCEYIRATYPEIPIIIDAKRGDIGNTNEGYAQFVFDYLQADAITVQPYLSGEALKPFLNRVEKGIIVLCRTSNPGSGEFQNLEVNGKHLYQIVAEKVSTDWNKNNNCMLVVGATYPEELAQVRKMVGEMMLLVPGVGVQGGDIEKTVKAGLNSKKTGMMINSSRGVIFASSEKDFAQKAREEAKKIQDEINKYRT